MKCMALLQTNVVLMSSFFVGLLGRWSNFCCQLVKRMERRPTSDSETSAADSRGPSDSKTCRPSDSETSSPSDSETSASDSETRCRLDSETSRPSDSETCLSPRIRKLQRRIRKLPGPRIRKLRLSCPVLEIVLAY